MFLTLTLTLAVALQDPGPGPDEVRSAIRRALPLLEKSAHEYTVQRSCFSCHHQARPVLALARARDKGFPIDEKILREQLAYTLESLERGRSAYKEGRGQGGKGHTAGYALWTLEIGGWKPDETTDVVAAYLLGLDKDGDHWPIPNNRPPLEVSSFATTYLAARALQAYGKPEQKAAIAERIEKARKWLVTAPPKDTEDRVFRLRALRFTGAGDEAVAAAAKELAGTQRPDGGWSQLDGSESDAYATGSALSTLSDFGGMAAADPAYRRAARFLVDRQKEDGSWHVATRSKPIQKYFESGFPHGKDQFISITATGWAVAALAAAVPR
jgi:hypothetical protein